MDHSAGSGRASRRIGWVWLLSTVLALALVPAGAAAQPAFARAHGASAGLPRAQVEVDDDQDQAEADDRDEDRDDHAALDVYESPTFGFLLEYDPDVWEITNEDSDDFGDYAQFFNGPSFVTIEATAIYGGDPGDCLDAWAESLAGGDGVEDFVPLEDQDGDPIAEEGDESARAAFAYTSDDGDEVFDVSCRALIEDEATIAVVLETFEDLYEDQVEEVDNLLGGLDLSNLESTQGRRDDDGSETIVDDFEDEDDGVFTTESSDPDLVQYAYDDGEFVIETLEPDAGVWQVQLPGPYADVVVAVDARIEGRANGRFVKIGCRFDRTSDGFEEYSFVVDPEAQRALLYRSDGEDIEVLADEDGFEGVNPDDETNRLELACIGETITATINGEEVAEVEDDSYAEGAVYLGAGTYAGVRGTVEARFDDLAVTVLGEGDAGDDDDRDREDDDDDVIREDFADEDGGLIRASENDLARYSYDDGEFVMEWLPDDGFGSAVISFFPSEDGPVEDVVVAIDVRLVGESADRAVLVGCREGEAPDGDTGAYRLMVEPDARAVTLFYMDAAEPVVLARETRVRAIERGEEVNRIALACLGETIEATVNGEVVISVEDDALVEGAVSLGVEVGSDEPGPAEARWDNLEVRIAG